MLLNFLVVRLQARQPQSQSPSPRNGNRSLEVYLRFKATDDSAEDFSVMEAGLASFCFPLGPEEVAPKEFMASEEYTFTLTWGDGRRFQGFCRKFLPPAPPVGSKARYPQVLCLISEYPWYNFFFKVLGVLEQVLRSGEQLVGSNLSSLPASSPAGQFLANLGRQLSPEPQPGQVLSVPLPSLSSALSVSPMRGFMSLGGSDDPLNSGEDHVALQVPPDCGNGKCNCGVSLARLLWHVPVGPLMTLLAAMLLERRIILVGQSKDTTSACVQAAVALLYPFKWHHIYLPLLPKHLKDYLTAPMPFLIGMPAQLLPMLRGIPMDEVTMIDLDLGKVESPNDDSLFLPWRDQLEAALTVAYQNLRSPTEFESNPFIASVVQDYLLKLMGNYRSFIHDEASGGPSTPGAGSHLGGVPGPNGQPLAPQKSGASTSGRGEASHHRREASGDDTLRGSGHFFDQHGFVSWHRHNDKARKLLAMMRHSQLWEVFIQDKLREAKDGLGPADPFDVKAAKLPERRKQRLIARLGAMDAQGRAKWHARVRKHRRTESEETQSSTSKSASVALSMRRITTDPTNMGGGADSHLPSKLYGGGLNGASSGGLGPSARPGLRVCDTALFFEDDEELLDELERMAEVEAAAIEARERDSFGLRQRSNSHGSDLHVISSEASATSSRSTYALPSPPGSVHNDAHVPGGGGGGGGFGLGHGGTASPGVPARPPGSLARTSAPLGTKEHGAYAPAPTSSPATKSPGGDGGSQGVVITTNADGTKTYDANRALDYLKLAVHDVKNLFGGKDRPASPQMARHSVALMQSTGQHGGGSSSSRGGLEMVNLGQQHGRGDGMGAAMEGLASKVKAGTSALSQAFVGLARSIGDKDPRDRSGEEKERQRAFSTPLATTPGTYRTQYTGSELLGNNSTHAHKYKPQLTGGSLLDDANTGRLKQPPAPLRPLLHQQQQPAGAASSSTPQQQQHPLQPSPAGASGQQRSAVSASIASPSSTAASLSAAVDVAPSARSASSSSTAGLSFKNWDPFGLNSSATSTAAPAAPGSTSGNSAAAPADGSAASAPAPEPFRWEKPNHSTSAADMSGGQQMTIMGVSSAGAPGPSHVAVAAAAPINLIDA